MDGSASEAQIEKLLNYRNELNEILKSYKASENDLLSFENSEILEKLLEDSDMQEGELELEINHLTTQIWVKYNVRAVEIDVRRMMRNWKRYGIKGDVAFLC